MRFLLIALIALYFTGCGRDSKSKDKHSGDKKHAEQTGSDITEGSESEKTTSASEPSFTITHSATDFEPVYAYLSKNIANLEHSDENDLESYELLPSSCIKVKESQFSNLRVRIGAGGAGWSDTTFIACGSPSNLCRVSHYEILDLGEPHTSWWKPNTWKDDFNLVPVKHPNTSDSCLEIEKWMKRKKSSQQQTMQSPNKTVAVPHTFVPAP